MNKISIITVVFNSASTIGSCIESVKAQTIEVEHIIIDGKSTDETLNIIDKYSSDIAVIVSEKDKGMYDAINKGLSLATGDVIGLLHADDLYSKPDILSKVAAVFEKNVSLDSCYGDLIYVDPEDTKKTIRYWKSGDYNYKKFYRGWMPPHPTFFVRKKIYQKYGCFRLDKGTAADYELMLRFLVKYRISSAYIPEVIIKMRTGGMSNMSLKNRLLANYNDRMAWESNNLRPFPWTLYMKPLSKIKQYIVKPPVN